jgi:TRAP-type mannitol/chloroaromatic compound transport system permease small subunit
VLSAALRAADALSRAAGVVAVAAAVALIGAMLWEVGARYLFRAPTIWAADLAAWLNGAVFLLGAGWALLADAHVRIDFLASRLPPRVRAAVEAAFMALVMLPVAGLLAHTAFWRTLRAVERGEVELVSSWRPPLWPFYAVAAAGLAVFALQVLAQAVRAAAEAAGRPVR